MKKIINGKMYNTETATRVAQDYSEPCSRTDFGFWWEGLYLKKTGEYFLQGEGGGMSRYAESYGQNSWSWGERIIPMTKSEAMSWAEHALSADKFTELFGEVAE